MDFLKKLARQNKQEIITGIFSVIIIAALFILASYLFRNYQPSMENIISTKSVLGMLLFVLVFIISIIFVPISAMPLIPIGVHVWGIAISTALSVIGWTSGAMIAFYLARRFGRPFVAKMIPLQKMEKVERLIPEENIFLTIFFFRAVTPFDGLSYILGLFTRIKSLTFFLATLFGLIPFCLAVSYLGSLPTIFLIIGLMLAGLFCIAGIIGIKRRNSAKLKK